MVSAVSSDILKWWDFHELEYPHLAKVARDYAGIPRSSVPRYACLDASAPAPLQVDILRLTRLTIVVVKGSSLERVT
jgi:hypothetical protein